MKWLHRIGAVLVWIALLALVTYALAFVYGCGGSQPQPTVAGSQYVLAHVGNTAGPVLADWSIARAGCPVDMPEPDCAMLAMQRDHDLWQAWEAFARAVNTGGDVVGAYCRVLEILPDDAPPVLRVKGVCP